MVLGCLIDWGGGNVILEWCLAVKLIVVEVGVRGRLLGYQVKKQLKYTSHSMGLWATNTFSSGLFN